MAVPAKRGLPKLKWWQWALIVFGVLVLVSIIVNAVGGRGRTDRAAEGARPAATAKEVAAPAPERVDVREAMPGLVGLTVTEARSAAEAAEFVIAVEANTGGDWVVLTQTIGESRLADAGTEVFVTAPIPV